MSEVLLVFYLTPKQCSKTSCSVATENCMLAADAENAGMKTLQIHRTLLGVLLVLQNLAMLQLYLSCTAAVRWMCAC